MQLRALACVVDTHQWAPFSVLQAPQTIDAQPKKRPLTVT